ncbi:MAG: hypothetical protein AAGE52_39715 [Myxococcota bacterium]
MTSRWKRVVAGVLTSSFVVGVALWSTGDADAQRRRRRGRQAQPRAEQTPHSEAIAPALGDVEWGWSKRQLLGYFTKKLRAEYQPRINKARDAMTEDRLRHERDQRIRRMRDSYVSFTGQTSGYDSGFLRDEFSHNNSESMVRVRSDNADDYYFFIRGRLWKWYRAFDSSVFQGADWAQFGEALQGRFGPARERTGALVEGGDSRTWLEWQDDATRARAIDNNTFYGFYCLVFEDKGTLSRLGELRTNEQRRGRRSHALVDAVTGDGEEAENPDAHADIVDRITGNIRNRQDAPDNDMN